MGTGTRALLAVLVTLGAVSFCAAPARGAPVSIAATPWGWLSVLAGDAVVFHDDAADLALGRAGSPARTLRRATPEHSFWLRASATRLAFSTSQRHCEDSGSNGDESCEDIDRGAFVGPLTGPYGPLGSRTVAFALAGDALATVERVTPTLDRILVRDLATGAAPVEVAQVPDPDPGTTHLDLAGNFVAFAREGAGPITTVIVFDIAARAEAYRLTVPSFLFAIDVQDDGTVAMTPSNYRGPVVWASRADPTAHTLAHETTHPARIAGGRIAFVRPIGRSGRGHHAQVVVTDLDGVAKPVTRRFREITAMDFDGTRVAYWADGCVYAGTAATGPVYERGVCSQMALAVRGVPGADIRRDRTTTFTVRCLDTPGSVCRGTLSLYRGDGETVPRNAPRIARAAFRVPVGGSRTVRLEVARTIRPWRGRRWIRAVARAKDPRGVVATAADEVYSGWRGR